MPPPNRYPRNTSSTHAKLDIHFALRVYTRLRQLRARARVRASRLNRCGNNEVVENSRSGDSGRSDRACKPRAGRWTGTAARSDMERHICRVQVPPLSRDDMGMD